jgi:hypothetical protein
MMFDAYALKEGDQGLILATPISLNSPDLAIELSLNKILKIMKTLKNLGLTTQ